MSQSQTVRTSSEPLSYAPSAQCDAVRVRRYDIDWLRVLAMLGVFFFHSARFFDPFDWHVKNEQHSTAALVFVGFLNCWQMPLLMLLAGAGSWYALQRRSGGQFKPFRRFELMQSLQNSIALGSLRLPEDVKRRKPRGKSRPGQEKNRDCPGKVIDPPANRSPVRPVWLIVTKTSVFHLLHGAEHRNFHAVRAGSNDEPQPQVREAFGFTM